MRANFVMSGVGTGLRRNLLMSIALVLITAVSLVFLGTAFLAGTEINRFRNQYEGNLNVSVYLCSSTVTKQCPHRISDLERAAILQQLRGDSHVRSFSYVSEQQAYERGKVVLGDTVAKYLKPGALPSSFTVRLRDPKQDYAVIDKNYSTVSGVDSVQNEDDSLKTILNILDSARVTSYVGALVVLFCAIVLMAITIQVAAAQRRNETNIMRLVGASRWMTELPFMIEAIIAAALGGILAIVALFVGKSLLLNGIFHPQVSRGIVPDLSVNDVLIAGGACLGVGVLLAAVTAFVTLRAYVRV
jgi:cell division transport system permease protein